MRSVDRSIREGRNPAWRRAWEGLDPESRAAVRAAIKERTPLGEPALQPFIEGQMARARRSLRWMPIQIGIVACLIGMWLYATAVLHPSPLAGFYAVMLLVDLVGGPLIYRRRSRRLAEVERAMSRGFVPRDAG